MAYEGSHISLGEAVCEALGLDAKHTANITITFEPGNFGVATVEHLVYGESAAGLERVLRTYAFTAKLLSEEASEPEPLLVTERGQA